MFSIIIVYNSVNIQASLTLNSLRRQTEEYELILLENIGNRNFKSAAAALNAGASSATGDFLMFVHQDVDFLDEQFLEKTRAMLEQIDDLGIAGVAGMSENGIDHHDRQRNLIYQGVPRRTWGNMIQKIERVQTLDECLLVIPRSVFKKTQFDEVTCDNWHLYGVDYCLTIAGDGLAAYVLPMFIYHQSAGDSAKVRNNFFRGSLSPSYFKSFEAVRRKHRNHIDNIHTTCASFSTNYPVLLQRAFRAVSRLINSK
jgi:GT2 family glycosyltransferase